MTQTPIAEDFGDIAARLKAITSPPAALRAPRYGIRHTWGSVWLCVINGWWYYAQELPPSLYTTIEEAQAVINAEPESFRKVCEAREYPEQ